MKDRIYAQMQSFVRDYPGAVMDGPVIKINGREMGLVFLKEHGVLRGWLAFPDFSLRPVPNDLPEFLALVIEIS